MKLHSYVLLFFNQKTDIHINFARVLWSAFSIPSDSLSCEIPLGIATAASSTFFGAGSKDADLQVINF
jgi:hypothetical protein